MNKLVLIALIAALPLSSLAQTKTKKTVKKESVVSPSGDVETKTVTTETTETESTPATAPVPEATPAPSLGEKAKQKAGEAKDFVQSTISNGGDRREASRFSIVGEYSVIDLLIPGKIGGSLGYIQDRSSAIEAEYLSASYSVPAFIEDIGSFDDKRISIVRRVYGDRNSFNFHYGLSYFDTSISVGSKYLASATGSNAYFEMMKQRTLGFIVGIGNRWTFPKGFTVGVDWVSYAQPLIVVDQDSSIINRIQDQGAKDTLQTAFQASLYFPRFSFFKVGLGWTF